MTRQSISRRDFLRTTGLVAGTAALAACAVPGAAPAGGNGDAMASEPKTIEFVSGWGGALKPFEEIAQLDGFKALAGEDTVFNVRLVGLEDLAAALAAGDTPDGGSNIDYPGHWARGIVLDCTDYVNGSEIIDPSGVLEPVWNAAVYGSNLIGVPAVEGFMWYGMNYNAKHVEEVGLDVDDPPLTWEAVMEWHVELSKFDEGGNVLRMGFDPVDAMAAEPDFIAHSFGHAWWNDEEQTFHFDHELMALGIETQAEFFRHIGPDNFGGLRSVQGQGRWGGSYNAEVQSMIMDGYWHCGETVGEKPELAPFNRSTWPPVPAFREGAKIQATGAHMIQIFKDAKNPDGMFHFAEFMHTNEPMNIIFDSNGWIMGVKSFIATIDPDTYPGLRFYLESVDEVTDWIIGRRCPIHWYLYTQVNELREKVYRDFMTAEEAVAEMQKRAEAEWEAQGLS